MRRTHTYTHTCARSLAHSLSKSRCRPTTKSIDVYLCTDGFQIFWQFCLWHISHSDEYQNSKMNCHRRRCRLRRRRRAYPFNVDISMTNSVTNTKPCNCSTNVSKRTANNNKYSATNTKRTGHFHIDVNQHTNWIHLSVFCLRISSEYQIRSNCVACALFRIILSYLIQRSPFVFAIIFTINAYNLSGGGSDSDNKPYLSEVHSSCI